MSDKYLLYYNNLIVDFTTELFFILMIFAFSHVESGATYKPVLSTCPLHTNSGRGKDRGGAY